jgi:hypothetical protein
MLEQVVRLVILGGVKFIFPETRPKVHGFKPGRDWWIFGQQKSVERLSSEGK